MLEYCKPPIRGLGPKFYPSGKKNSVQFNTFWSKIKTNCRSVNRNFAVSLKTKILTERKF